MGKLLFCSLYILLFVVLLPMIPNFSSYVSQFLVGKSDCSTILDLKSEFWENYADDKPAEEVVSRQRYLVKRIHELEVLCIENILERGKNISDWIVPFHFREVTQHFQIAIGSERHYFLVNQLLDTFRFFHDFFETNEMCYSLFGGALISSYSNSFIPWDDDIDVVLKGDKAWKYLIQKFWLEIDEKMGACDLPEEWSTWKCKIVTGEIGRLEVLRDEENAPNILKVRLNLLNEFDAFFLDIFRENHRRVEEFDFDCDSLVKKNFPPPYHDLELSGYFPQDTALDEMLTSWYSPELIDRRKIHPTLRKLDYLYKKYKAV